MALMGASTACWSDADDGVALELVAPACEAAPPTGVPLELAAVGVIALEFAGPEVVACSESVRARTKRPARTEAV